MANSAHGNPQTSATKKRPTASLNPEPVMVNPEDGLHLAMQDLEEKLGPKEFIRRLLSHTETPEK